MKLLCLDISSKTGWALFERKDAQFRLVKYGLIQITTPTYSKLSYPHSFLASSFEYLEAVLKLIRETDCDLIVCEETNKSRNRYSQKLLEFLHFSTLSAALVLHREIKYISTSEWRSTLNLRLTKDDKTNNKMVSKAKKESLSKKDLGVVGKITPKHLSVRYCNAEFNLQFKQKDNDIADAICLGAAYFKGVSFCNGE